MVSAALRCLGVGSVAIRAFISAVSALSFALTSASSSTCIFLSSALSAFAVAIFCASTAASSFSIAAYSSSSTNAWACSVSSRSAIKSVSGVGGSGVGV